MPNQPDLDRLLSQLVTSGVQKNNPGLYQVIAQLIKATKQLQDAFGGQITVVSGGVTALSNLDLLTHSDQSIALPNSRQLVAGTSITFDDTVVNQRILNVNVVEREWSVLTDGNLIEPELVFAGGDVIMLHTP